MGRAWQALGQKLAWNSRLRYPRGHGPRQPHQPHPRWGITVGGPEAPKNEMFTKLTVRPPHPFQCTIMTILAPLMNVKSTQPLWSDSAKFHFGGLWASHGDAPPRVGLAWLARAMASGVPQTTIPCQLLPQSLPSTTHFAVLEHAMVVVWVALHVPVQVLPHDLPTEAHGDPPSRTSVTCQ